MEVDLPPPVPSGSVIDGDVVGFRYCKQKRKTLYWYTSDREFFVDNVRYVIPKGYEFDGATVPRPLWGVFAPGGVAFRAASLHDWLYDTKGQGIQDYRPSDFTIRLITRKRVDEIFLKHMLQDGTPRLQAWIMYLAVRTPVGGQYWKKDSFPYYLIQL